MTTSVLAGDRGALRALLKHGGQGEINAYGMVVAEGHVLRYDAKVWLRLMIDGHVEAAGSHCLRITLSGRCEARNS